MEEVGDLIFAAVDVARMCGIDPEQAVHQACEKSMRRFAFIEFEAAKSGRHLEDMTLGELEELHQKARQTLEGKTPVYDKLEYFNSLKSQ